MILKLSHESKIFYSEEGRYKRNPWWWRKNMYEVFFYMCELRQQIMKYFDFSLENADLDHMVRFFYFPMGQCKMQTADWLWTIVFRVRKQWDYCCHVLICMVKTIVCSLRHFTLTNPIQSGSGKYITYMSPIHTAIPCHPSCSGQGMCLKDGQCLCWWGWTGPNAKYIVSGSLKNRILVRAEWPP